MISPEPESDAFQPELGSRQKAYSEFKARCQEQGVWDRYIDQHRALKAAGHGDWASRDLLMPIWDNFLQWMEAGNRRKDWDFDRFRPVHSVDDGAFEVFKLEIKRNCSIHQILLEDRMRVRMAVEAGRSKDKSIQSDESITLGSIGGIKLRTPNSTVTRAEEVQWAYENLFAYQALMDEKNVTGSRHLMEGAPSFGACTQLQYAYSAPTQFMSNLNKNSPTGEENLGELAKEESKYAETLALMERSFKIVCPSCSSKF